MRREILGEGEKDRVRVRRSHTHAHCKQAQRVNEEAVGGEHLIRHPGAHRAVKVY